MLAELAAANAAFAVIKTAVQNGRELQEASGAIVKFVGAREELARRAKKKKKPGVQTSELEEFMALEKLKQQEAQLKELMIWTGRPGLWNDWQKYQAEARKSRRVQEALARKRREEFIQAFLVVLGVLLGVGGVVLLLVWGLFLTAL